MILNDAGLALITLEEKADNLPWLREITVIYENLLVGKKLAFIFAPSRRDSLSPLKENSYVKAG